MSFFNNLQPIHITYKISFHRYRETFVGIYGPFEINGKKYYDWAFDNVEDFDEEITLSFQTDYLVEDIKTNYKGKMYGSNY